MPTTKGWNAAAAQARCTRKTKTGIDLDQRRCIAAAPARNQHAAAIEAMEAREALAVLLSQQFGFRYQNKALPKHRKMSKMCLLASIRCRGAAAPARKDCSNRRPVAGTALATAPTQMTATHSSAPLLNSHTIAATSSDPCESPRHAASQLATAFALTAAKRDVLGGTPKAERDALRASGLLALSIPEQYGGYGASWREALDIVRILGRADSSIAHVFGFHHLMLATTRLFGSPAQWEPWFEQTARHRWFWGNALNPLDERAISHSHRGWREFTGQKSFCSGALDSEMLIASARDADSNALIVAAVPSRRTGISIAEDWDNIGQRQTDSGTVTFEKVRVEHHEVLADPGPLSTPFACLRPLLAQLILTNVYLGISEAAFEDARHYTLCEARPWPFSDVDTIEKEPYVLNQYGEFWIGLEAARVLTDRAADQFDAAWKQGARLTDAERGEVALSVATAKVTAVNTGLNLCTRMFDVAGARATHGALRLDRHWRNLRTHSLHDPLAYKLREIGEWALMRKPPTPSFYS